MGKQIVGKQFNAVKGIQTRPFPLTWNGGTPTGPINEWKGSVFNPPLYLNSRTLYLFMTTPQENYLPRTGWYDVPELGHLTWISGFRIVAKGQKSPVGYITYVFQAVEGNPPVGMRS